jgi:hypothetical protein
MKNILILLISLTILNTYSQETISFSMLQDAKLLITGDDKGNPPGTTDLIFNMNWEGKQFEYYYFSIQTQFEYANLQSKFYRYSVHGIWTLNRLFIPKLEASIGLGFGVIHRDIDIDGMGTYSATGELAYPITKKIMVLAKYEIVRRSDLIALYNSKPFVPNLAIGVKLKPFK